MRIVETPSSPRVWGEAKEMRARVDVPFDLVEPVLRTRPTGQIRYERINDLSPLWPESHFRKAMLEAARIFVREMAKKRARYQLKHAEGDTRIYGPYQHKEAGHTVQVGNLLLPKVHARTDRELYAPDKVDFLIIADFVAEFGAYTEDVTEEERRVVTRESVDLWAQVERALGNRGV